MLMKKAANLGGEKEIIKFEDKIRLKNLAVDILLKKCIFS